MQGHYKPNLRILQGSSQQTGGLSQGSGVPQHMNQVGSYQEVRVWTFEAWSCDRENEESSERDALSVFCVKGCLKAGACTAKFAFAGKRKVFAGK